MGRGGGNSTGVSRSKKLATISVFAALIALMTILVIPMPAPLAEITLAPAIYLALAVLVGPWPAFVATAVGSFIGETYNTVSFGYPPIYILGIVWARAPEALIVGWARIRGLRSIALMMVVASVYETLAFFFPDWAFYAYGLFGYGNQYSGFLPGLAAALPDLGTTVDLVFIPIALAIVKKGRASFHRLGF
jgi:uncharacterized membrane protein